MAFGISAIVGVGLLIIPGFLFMLGQSQQAG